MCPVKKLVINRLKWYLVAERLFGSIIVVFDCTMFIIKLHLLLLTIQKKIRLEHFY